MAEKSCTGAPNISGRPVSIAIAGLADADAIDPGLDALSLDETLAFVRGFMLFSLLANLAEDRQGVAAEEGATVVEAIELLASEGVDRQAILDLLDEALIAPVLTAHPTEVRRKSIIDHKSRIAELLLMKDDGEYRNPDGDMLDAAILRQIALLWQTRPLRRERLFVTDEVQISQSYMKDVFLPVLPRLYAKWERILGARLPSFLKLNSWIGGDRDGNPFVDADAHGRGAVARGRNRDRLLSDARSRAGRRALHLDRTGRSARCSAGAGRSER